MLFTPTFGIFKKIIQVLIRICILSFNRVFTLIGTSFRDFAPQTRLCLQGKDLEIAFSEKSII